MVGQHDESLLSDMLPVYYTRLFPQNVFCRWLACGSSPQPLAHRELSFTLADDVYLRYLSITNQKELQTLFQKKCPHKIDIGAVYNNKPSIARHDAVVLSRELVFDIDLTDYDEVRTCCQEAKVCEKCWKFMVVACEIIDKTLREDFGFQSILWVFSGRRGVHCWVSDYEARTLDSPGRGAVADYLCLISGGENQSKKVNLGSDNLHSSIRRALNIIDKHFEDIVDDQDFFGTPERLKQFLKIIPDENLKLQVEKNLKQANSLSRWSAFVNTYESYCRENGSTVRKIKYLVEEIKIQYCYPRLDVNVTKGFNHLLKAPFSIHPKTGKVSIVFKPNQAKSMKLEDVPNIYTLLDDSAPGSAEHQTNMRTSVKHFQEVVFSLEKSEAARRKIEAMLRSRRYTLTPELRNTHSQTLENIQSAVSTEITYNNEEHVCNRCWVRAGRGRLIQNNAESVQDLLQDAQRIERVPEPQEKHNPSILLQPDFSEEELDNVMVQQPQQSPDNTLANEGEENRNPPQLNADVSFSLPGYSRAPNAGRSCIFYGCENTTRQRIPESVKMKMAMEHDYYIPPEARVCHIHASTNSWQMLLDSPNRLFNFNPRYTLDMLQLVKKANNRRIDFERIEDFDAHELHYWTGRTIEQFLQILQETPSLAQRSRKPKATLGVYLAKIRTGEADNRLATLFHMTRQNLEHKFNVARQCLTYEFEPLHWGFDHISREELANRHLLIPKTLYCDANNQNVTVICDAAYIFIQKSANFAFQKDTYRLHKYRNLLKPFIIVSTDGYILDVLGPYGATKNDASILHELLEHENSVLPWYFNNLDVFILDRGFRDVVRTVEDFGYRAVIPVGSVSSSQQLNTDQANKSRLCTICRWPVEVVNGRIKRDFRIFRQNYFNKSMLHMFQDFRIAAALTNAFHIPLEDNRYAVQFLTIIERRLNHPNRLADYVDANNLNRQRVAFNNIRGDVQNLSQFPQITLDELILFSVGTYQLKLAASYYSEHVRGGDYVIEICAQQQVTHLENFDLPHENDCLIRARIKSRHSGSKIYFCFILVDNNLEGRASIDNDCCNCFTGRRTIGVCAHIMSVVWYLAWARHQDSIHRPALYLDEVIHNND